MYLQWYTNGQDVADLKYFRHQSPRTMNLYLMQWYQLLTALCGTVLQAQIEGSALAVLVVHEFIPDAVVSLRSVK